MANDDLDDNLVVRCNSKRLKNFKRKAEQIASKPYTLVVRDIMDALNDNRLTITLAKGQKAHGELYK